ALRRSRIIAFISVSSVEAQAAAFWSTGRCWPIIGSVRSAPEQKARPLLASSSALTSPDAAKSATAARIASIISRESAFSASGRLSVMRPMPSRVSIRTWSLIRSDLDADLANMLAALEIDKGVLEFGQAEDLLV